MEGKTWMIDGYRPIENRAPAVRPLNLACSKIRPAESLRSPLANDYRSMGRGIDSLFSLRICLLEKRIRNDFGYIVCYDDSSISLSNISFHLSKPRFLRRDERVEEKRAWIENCDNDIDVIGDWV